MNRRDFLKSLGRMMLLPLVVPFIKPTESDEIDCADIISNYGFETSAGIHEFSDPDVFARWEENYKLVTIKKCNASEFFVATSVLYTSMGGEVYRTDDAGLTWTEIAAHDNTLHALG